MPTNDSLDNTIQSALNEITKDLGGLTPLNELFPPKIMQQYTHYENIGEFFADANITDQTSFDVWFETDVDAYVSARTAFSSWHEFFNVLGKPYVIRSFRYRGKPMPLEAQLGDTFDSIYLEVNVLAK